MVKALIEDLIVWPSIQDAGLFDGVDDISITLEVGNFKGGADGGDRMCIFSCGYVR